MGSNGSKEDDEEEGLPAKYARGISSTEFSHQWRNNSKYKGLKEQLVKREMSKSCVTIYGDKIHEADASVMLLSKTKLNPPPRLQAIGVKQKSYVNQLIEHRSKYNLDNETTKKSDQTHEQNALDIRTTGDPFPLKKVIENSTKIIGKQNINDISNNLTENFIRVNFNKTKKKQKPNKEDDSSSSENTSSRPSSPSWTGSNSEESSLEGNISMAEGLETIRSDMTVVPYDQAKARFESGGHKKRLKKSEDYVQLEQLGLGFWNNDQWVPTKVVTLAISDQLSCAGGDWPANYRYRSSNFNCQSFRATFSEVQY